ncbi:MAG: ABC1 kinase family protein [Candidatus Methanofastidiosia archaeon]
MITGMKRNVKYINRYRQIVSVLAKYGFGHLVDQMGLGNLLPRARKKELKTKLSKRSLAVTYRLILEELGPTFIKFGQILSTRPDMISSEYVVEFSKLQDSVKPIGFEKIKSQIEKELDAPLDTIFTEIDKTPIASASIAQVHKATLLSGEVVAVKVQKPDVERTIAIDVEIMKNLSKRVGGMMAQRSPYDIEDIVEEFSKAIKKELDYTLEAANAEKFYREFEDDPTVKIPKIFEEYTTKRIMFMEYIDGIKVSEIEKLGFSLDKRKRIAEIGAKALLKMIFTHGFFHADPHPANIFVIDEETISFLDFGIVGKISKTMKKRLTDLLISIIRKDSNKITEFLMFIADDSDINKDELAWEIEDLIDIYYGKLLEKINMGEFMEDLVDIAKRYKIKIPKNFVLFGKALLMIEGVGRQLYPSFNSVEYTQPYVKILIKERMGPENRIKEWYESLSQTKDIVLNLPLKLDKIISKFGKGSFKVSFDKNNVEDLTDSFERSVNRLAFSIVITGMVLASSILVMADIGPMYYDFPIMGWFGFILSFALGIYLIRAILKSHRL